MRNFFLMICLLVAISTMAQSILPQMNTTLINHEKPIRLQNLTVSVYIMGGKAKTTLECEFYNPNNRILEGEFVFPLLSNMEVSGFALDINGKLRQGVVVNKNQARQTFENITRQNIDPALLEKTEGDNFKVRVYPFAALGSRKVAIEIVHSLEQKNNEYLYHLPIASPEVVIDNYSLSVKLATNNETQSTPTISGMQWQQNLSSSFSAQNYTIKDNITLSIPQHITQEAYNALHQDIQRFAGGFIVHNHNSEQAPPKRLAIYWDTSLSAKEQNHDAKEQFLQEYFQYAPNVSVSFFSFNITKSSEVHFTVKNGNIDALLNHIKKLTYQGGTSLASVMPLEGFDQIILFSDGLHNFAPHTFSLQNWVTSAKVPIICLSPLGGNAALLQQLASYSGGTFINLAQGSPTEWVAQIKKPTLSLLKVQARKGTLKSFFPKENSLVEGNSFSFAGEAVGSESLDIELSFGVGKKVLFTKQITLQAPQENSVKAQFLQHFIGKEHIAWAQKAGLAQKDIDELGKHYNIVTQGTSLIVLETLNDYIRYNITPPAELQNKLYKQYVLNKNQEDQRREEQRQAHLKRVLEASAEQSQWWKTTFPLPGTTPKSSQEPQVLRAAPQYFQGEERAMGESVQIEVGDVVDLRSTEVPFSKVQTASKSLLKGTSRSQANLTSTPSLHQTHVQMQLQPFNPETPYYKVLEYATEENLELTYQKLALEYGLQPTFYVDCADFFFKKGKNELATLIVSTLAELETENVQLLRILAYKLIDYKLYSQAIYLLERIVALRSEEPQVFRDLAHAYALYGNPQKAVKTLYEAVTLSNERFWGIELIALNEINQILNRNKHIQASFMPKELRKEEPVDIRIVLEWDTDNVDIDLWVTDPYGERCFYSNPLTYIGGKLSRDFTQGYGPEEFMLKRAIKGKYTVQAQYYGTRTQKLLFPVTLKVKFYTHYGTSKEQMQQTTLRLTNSKETITLGSFEY